MEQCASAMIIFQQSLGEDLLTISRYSKLYTISIFDMAASSPICLMLLKFKYDKEHLCPACEQGKSKRAILKPKLVASINSKLEMIHIVLCALMRVESIIGKKYILVIADDYSRYTWVHFLFTKDYAPEMISKFITQIQRNIIQTLVEAARTILISSQAPAFLWAEAISTAYFTQNCSLVHTRYNKTPYELIKDRKPNVQYYHVCGSLCYPTNDCDDLGKMKPKAYIGIFIESTQTPSKEDLDNLFGPLYEEYYETRNPKVSTHSAATDTHNNEDTPSSSSVIVDDNEAPQIVSTSEEPIAEEPMNPVSDVIADESNQEDTTELDGNSFINLFCSPMLEEA
ncbi:retrovirus-related pol polyprotein from transposon TNT 1-94 [Tanacetum coccineum]